MKAAYPLFRLFWRPGVLLDLLVTSTFAVMLSSVGGMIGQALFSARGSVFGLFSETTYPASSLAPGFHVCLLAGAVIGTVGNFALQDLLYCRFSWNLPGLQGRLRVGLGWLAALAAGIGGVTGALLGAFDHGPGPLQGAALALAGFALGNQLWDPKLGRGFCFAAQLVLLAAVVDAPELQRGVEQVPWAAPLAALLFTALSIHRATKRDGRRARALVPKGELGASFRPGETTPIVNSFRGNASRTWGEGPIRERHGWIRALQYENVGWRSGSWKTYAVRTAAVVVLVLSAVNLAFAWYEGGSLRGSLEAMAAGVFEPLRPVAGIEHPPGTRFLPFTFGFVGLVIAVGSRLDLRRGVVYPLSRAERAEIVWRACLSSGLALLLSIASLLVLIGLAAAWRAGVELALHRVPEVVIATTLTALGLPILQWGRLRLVDSGRISVSSATFGALAGMSLLLFLLGLRVALAVLREAEPMTAAVVALGVVPVLWILVQVRFRASLRRWFATTDLV